MKALASLLRRMADRIDAPVLAPAPTTVSAKANSDERFLDDLILRDALQRALNRYQPFRPPVQA